MRSVLAYTLARALLFAAALGIVYLLGARGFLALVIALVASGLMSYVLLARQRDAMSEKLVQGIARVKDTRQRLEEGAQKEDSGA